MLITNFQLNHVACQRQTVDRAFIVMQRTGIDGLRFAVLYKSICVNPIYYLVADHTFYAEKEFIRKITIGSLISASG